MPAFATDQQLDRLEAERLTREAWSAYRAALGGLDGKEYEAAEETAWDRLQRRLAEIPR
jgi:hypothetical protein